MPVEIDDTTFNQMVADAIDAIPEEHGINVKNVAFVVEDYPNEEQMKQLNLRHRYALFGLFQGTPRTQRSTNAPVALPDKITIFKQPLVSASHTIEELKAKVYNTVWHEVAHYFGLDHDQISRLER